MTWYGWLYVELLLVGIIYEPIPTGKERKPITGQETAISVFVGLGYLAGTLFVGTGHI